MPRSEHLADTSTDGLHDERDACLRLIDSNYYRCSEPVTEYHADYADRISDEIDSRTKDAVTLYDIKTNTVWETMSLANGESSIQYCYDLGDTIQEYDTTDRAGTPLRIVLQINAPSEYREVDQGGVYVFPR